MEINLQLSRDIFLDKFYPLLTDYSHRWECYMGSSGSGKSYFIAQKIIYRCLTEKIKVLVCRRYASTLRDSCFSLFKEILHTWKIDRYCKITEGIIGIKFPNGSQILFKGLDEETKLLSLNDISCVFIEEVFEVSQDIVEQIDLRMRGSADNQQIFMAWNPISKQHWLYEWCEVNPPKSFLYNHSTYLDNPRLPKDYVEAIENLRERNPQKFRVFGLGEWGTPSKGLVFKNWRIEDFDLSELEGLEHRTGLDFGYRDPSTIVDTMYDRKNKRIYVFNEFYKTGCQLDTLAKAAFDMDLSKSIIWCDSAEPRSIDYLRKQGLNAKPAVKGKDSVEIRIAFLQNHEIIIHPSCKEVEREISNFSYIKNRDGEYTNKTTHEFSHTIDALGYGYSDIYKSNKLQSINKSVLGL